MAKFKCILSGNTIELTSQVDIDSMKGHEGYKLVTEDSSAAEPSAKPAKKTPAKPAAPTEAE
jgi:hypothetical protein